ncbi:MAG TPA: MBL fold metallo-hydrolase [Gemmatimonadales bacterium]|nr:MBL fold metallo-hydrolase [Gemmatimonadales bacterium]
MTVLHVLGSGSRGNCFLLEADGRVLLLDAGFSARELTRRSEQAGVSLAAAVGIALTHEHGDHASGAWRLARLHGIPIAASDGTWSSLRQREGVQHRRLRGSAPIQLGPFQVECACSSHDAAEPVAIAVTCPDGTRVALAHDLGRPTAAVRLLLRECHALVVEANHDEVLLRTSGYPPSVQQRIAGSGGHLSNGAALDLLTEVLHQDLDLVVLAHLSARCNSAECARAAVEPGLRREGFLGRLVVAGQTPSAEGLHIARRTRVVTVTETAAIT